MSLVEKITMTRLRYALLVNNGKYELDNEEVRVRGDRELWFSFGLTVSWRQCNPLFCSSYTETLQKQQAGVLLLDPSVVISKPAWSVKAFTAPGVEYSLRNIITEHSGVKAYAVVYSEEVPKFAVVDYTWVNDLLKRDFSWYNICLKNCGQACEALKDAVEYTMVVAPRAWSIRDVLLYLEDVGASTPMLKQVVSKGQLSVLLNALKALDSELPDKLELVLSCGEDGHVQTG